mmetsp:Transcript_21987/g.19543  ORF Transcript_21987/g.19543 Transcript_21987/m.19543 type:complete len:82 (+) Transcript_21987:387-632(+)
MNKLSKTGKKVGNKTDEIPELLTFKSFKSKATQNFENMVLRRKTLRKIRKESKIQRHEDLDGISSCSEEEQIKIGQSRNKL